MRAQGIQIALQLLPRVLVILGVPSQPSASRQREKFGQVFSKERLISNDIDGADPCRIAFNDREIDAYPVSLQRGYGSSDLRRVKASGKVLPLDFLLGLLED